MKLQDIMEEMGMTGIERISKNFSRLVKRLGLSGEGFKIGQASGGTTVIILKGRKPYAKVPISKALDANYLTAVLKKDFEG